MHIKFLNVTVKNFLSFGNAKTTFDYKEGIHAVVGSVIPGNKRNGAGKSTIIADALTFGLYGKPIRKIKKGSIINRVNRKDCSVVVEFEIGTKHYKVVRGIKPDVLEVYEDHSENSKEFDSKAHTQKWLESKLDISYESFTNLIVLNINLSEPFLEMNAAKKRSVMEDIGNLGIYAKMRELARKNHLSAQSDLKVLKSELKSAIDKHEIGLSRRESVLKEAKRFEEDKNIRIKELEKKIKDLKESIEIKIKEIKEKAYNEIDTIEATSNSSERDEKIYSDQRIEEGEKILKRKLKLLKEDIDKLRDTITGIDYEKELTNFESKLDKCEESIEKLNIKINECDRDIQDHERTIRDNEGLIGRIEGKSECPVCRTPTDNPVILETVDTSKKIIKESQIKVDELNESRDNYKTKLKEGISVKEKLIKKIRGLHEESNKQLKIHNEINEKEKEITSCKEELSNLAEVEKEKLKDKLKSIKEMKESKISSISSSLDERIEEIKSNIESSIKHTEESIQIEKNKKLDLDNVISEKEITKLKNELNEIKDNHDKANNDLVYNKYCRSLLSEDGIGKYVVKKMLPYLNKQMNSYLNMLGTEYTIKFDDELEATLVARNGEESEYTSFSGGEKKRIDLSILLALMDVAHSQNTVSTNILVLDEVIDTSMDSEGVETFMSHMKDSFKKIHPNKCIYVITHRKEINDDAFDSVVHVKKKNDFTEVSVS